MIVALEIAMIKGQKISKAFFLASNLPKRKQNFFDDFCPSLSNESNKKNKEHSIALNSKYF